MLCGHVLPVKLGAQPRAEVKWNYLLLCVWRLFALSTALPDHKTLASTFLFLSKSQRFITVTPGCVAVRACPFNVTERQPTAGFTNNTHRRPIFQQQTPLRFFFSPDFLPPFRLHTIDDLQSGSDTVNNEKWGFCRQMGWDMKADWSAGSGFLSEWLLINGADEGHNSSLARDCHSARQFSDHSHPHAAGLDAYIVWEQSIFFSLK